MEIVKMTLIIRLLKIAANFRSSVILTLCGERFSQVSPTLDKVPTRGVWIGCWKQYRECKYMKCEVA